MIKHKKNDRPNSDLSEPII